MGGGRKPEPLDPHWTPVQRAAAVDAVEAALARAIGARPRPSIRTEAWGKIVGLADPCSHGICLIGYLRRGYDEIAEPARPVEPRARPCSPAISARVALTPLHASSPCQSAAGARKT
jgi:hypothetical protein